MDRARSFTGIVRIAGINPYVEVPARLAQALRGGRSLASRVLVKVSGCRVGRSVTAPPKASLARDAARLTAIARLAPRGWFRTTIVPSRTGAPRLYLHQWMRAGAGLGVGDRVRVTLKSDRASRTPRMPAPLRAALDATPPARLAWEALAPSRRREILSYLGFLKTPAALERNVRKVIATLRRRRTRR
jgi:hypothetical protein